MISVSPICFDFLLLSLTNAELQCKERLPVSVGTYTGVCDKPCFRMQGLITVTDNSPTIMPLCEVCDLMSLLGPEWFLSLCSLVSLLLFICLYLPFSSPCPSDPPAGAEGAPTTRRISAVSLSSGLSSLSLTLVHMCGVPNTALDAHTQAALSLPSFAQGEHSALLFAVETRTRTVMALRAALIGPEGEEEGADNDAGTQPVYL